MCGIFPESKRKGLVFTSLPQGQLGCSEEEVLIHTFIHLNVYVQTCTFLDRCVHTHTSLALDSGGLV